MESIMFQIFCERPKEVLELEIEEFNQQIIDAEESVRDFRNRYHRYDMEDILYLKSRRELLASAKEALVKIELDAIDTR